MKDVILKPLKETYEGTPYHQVYYKRKKLFKILMHKESDGKYFYLVEFVKTGFSAGAENDDEMQEILDGMTERAIKRLVKEKKPYEN